MGMPGPLEIIIILFMGMICVGVTVALVVAVFTIGRKSGPSTPDSPPCPNCVRSISCCSRPAPWACLERPALCTADSVRETSREDSSCGPRRLHSRGVALCLRT